MQKVIYFIRHGESDHNKIPVFQPINSRLNNIGREQVNKVSKRFKKVSFDKIITSPINRAVETAEIIAKETGKNIEKSDLFSEMISPVVVHGKSYTDKPAMKIFEKWMKSISDPKIKVKDSENYSDLVKRVDMALDFIKNQKEDSIVVISHGFFIRLLVARIVFGETMTPENFGYFHEHIKSVNTGVTTVKYCEDYTGALGWRLVSYKDSAHLDDGK